MSSAILCVICRRPEPVEPIVQMSVCPFSQLQFETIVLRREHDWILLIARSAREPHRVYSSASGDPQISPIPPARLETKAIRRQLSGEYCG